MLSRLIVPSALVIVIGMMIAVTANSCSKGDCYDRELYELHRNDFCTTDCPGVTGCDGKTYCNECEANRNGIHVQP